MKVYSVNERSGGLVTHKNRRLGFCHVMDCSACRFPFRNTPRTNLTYATIVCTV